MAQYEEPESSVQARPETVQASARLDVLDATLSAEQAAPSLEAPSIRYDPEQSRDKARALITYWLLGLLTMLFVATFITYWLMPDKSDFANLKSLLEVLISPLIVLVSAATGFYFGAHSSGKNN
jgi:hypothetical protein